MDIHQIVVADLVIERFFNRFSIWCSWEFLTFEHLAWLTLYAQSLSLTLGQIKERWKGLS